MIRIVVSTKGESGYLHTEISPELRARYSLSLDPAKADIYSTTERAERAARKVAGRFDSVEVEVA